METRDRGYKEGDTIYILMTKDQADSALTEWLEGNRECDLRLRRSKKAKGCVVMETRDPMWAARIIEWYGYKKVIYRHKQ